MVAAADVELVGDLLHQGLRLVAGVLSVLRHGSPSCCSARKGVGARLESGAENAAARSSAVVGFYRCDGV
jgi:hypothetical protein